MSFLLRTQAGYFDIERSVTIEACRQAAERGELSALLAPMDAPIAHLPKLKLSEGYRHEVKNGSPIPMQKLELTLPGSTPIRVYLEDRFAGIAEMSGDGLLRFRAMLLGGEP